MAYPTAKWKGRIFIASIMESCLCRRESEVIVISEMCTMRDAFVWVPVTSSSREFEAEQLWLCSRIRIRLPWDFFPEIEASGV